MKIRIQTAQNVEIEYEIAGIGYRFQAALIDFALFLGYFAFFILLALVFDVEFDNWTLYVFLLPPIPLLLYPLLCEIFMRGQTIGKRAMNLKVVRTDGGEPSIGSYVLRWLFWLLFANPLIVFSGLGAVSVIAIIFTKLGQRIGDLAAGTTVVRLDRQEEPTRYVAPVFTPNYEPQFPEVRNLTPRDVGIIRNGYAAVVAGADDDLASRIAYRVAEVLAIPTNKVGETTGFLERILNDHAWFNRQAGTGTGEVRPVESDELPPPAIVPNPTVTTPQESDDDDVDPLAGY